MSHGLPAALEQALAHALEGRWRCLARGGGTADAGEPLAVALSTAARGGEPASRAVALAFAQLRLARRCLVIGEEAAAHRALARYVNGLQRALEVQHGPLPTPWRQRLAAAAQPLLHSLDSQLALQRLLHSGALAPRLTLVLGMHRSGTSALSGLLCRSGWDPPRDLLPSSAHNPLGYWESLSLMRHNDCLLQALDRCWNSLGPLPEGWQHGAAAQRWRQDMLALLPDLFNGAHCPLLKDPRLCLLLPGLIPWLAGGDLEVLILLCVRHPYEVACSLQAREAMDPQDAVRLWLAYVFAAERWSRGLPREVVDYRHLLAAPQEVLEGCRSRLGLPIPVGDSAAAIDPELHRQRLDQAAAEDLAQWSRHCGEAGAIALALYALVQPQSALEQGAVGRSIDRLHQRWLATV